MNKITKIKKLIKRNKTAKKIIDSAFLYKDKILKKRIQKLKLLISALKNISKNKKNFQGIKVFCMFVGYSRTGSTLVSSLLDAHPNIVMSNELDILKYVNRGFGKNILLSLILEKNKEFIQQGKKGGGYTYDIPNEWQGKFKTIFVIGDREPKNTALVLDKNPALIYKLKKIIGKPIKLIHVVRNPYNAITTETLRKKTSLRNKINEYFICLDAINKLKKESPQLPIITIKHEEFIADPKSHLKKLCQFLGVETSDDYLNDCTSIVYKTAHQSRYGIDWTQELIKLVKEKAKQYNVLADYSYDK